MRDRQRIIDTLENLYRNQLDSAAKDEDFKPITSNVIDLLKVETKEKEEAA